MTFNPQYVNFDDYPSDRLPRGRYVEEQGIDPEDLIREREARCEICLHVGQVRYVQSEYGYYIGPFHKICYYHLLYSNYSKSSKRLLIDDFVSKGSSYNSLQVWVLILSFIAIFNAVLGSLVFLESPYMTLQTIVFFNVQFVVIISFIILPNRDLIDSDQRHKGSREILLHPTQQSLKLNILFLGYLLAYFLFLHYMYQFIMSMVVVLIPFYVYYLGIFIRSKIQDRGKKRLDPHFNELFELSWANTKRYFGDSLSRRSSLSDLLFVQFVVVLPIFVFLRPFDWFVEIIIPSYRYLLTSYVPEILTDIILPHIEIILVITNLAAIQILIFTGVQPLFSVNKLHLKMPDEPKYHPPDLGKLEEQLV